MSDEAPLDLRALGDVDEPEVVRAALRRFRRRLWTRYVWVGLAIVFAAVAFVVSNQPRDLGDEIDRADVAYLPSDAVWDVRSVTVGIERVVDLGDDVGFEFVVIPDPGENATMVIVGAAQGMGSNNYTSYVKVAKNDDGVFTAVVGAPRCVPECPSQGTFTISMRELGIPATVWRIER